MSIIQDNEYISELKPTEMLEQNTFLMLLRLEDGERERVESVLILRAKELGIEKEFTKALRAFYRREKKLSEQASKTMSEERNFLQLDLDAMGRPLKTFKNFSTILKGDDFFSDVSYDLLQNAPVRISANGEETKWDDTDETMAEAYIEDKYNLRHHESCVGALSLLFRGRSFHPIRELIDSIKWDGERRIDSFLTIWMRCDNTPYTREVSRLIFHGGINRLYNPGCKFDEMPVFIGEQGGGKSTLVKQLAMKDEWAGEVNTFEGKEGVEALNGKWILEVSELLALTKTKEQEAVKAYLTRQVDNYRRPYDKYNVDLPRQCLFVATTNKETFLVDKTGNRRFLPVKCYQDGKFLFHHLAELQEFIRQCWAEAKHDYDEGKAPAYVNPDLLAVVRAAQSDATEDDWRVGAIATYLEDKDLTCTLDLWDHALNESFSKPTKKDQNEIALIMQQMGGWERTPPMRHPQYGLCRAWKRTTEDPD